jgi:hypothetical protein
MTAKKPSSSLAWNVYLCLVFAAINIYTNEHGFAFFWLVFGFITWLVIPAYKPEPKTEKPKS